MRTSLAAALALCLLAGAAPALAAGPNGGQVVVADGHPIEFVGTATGVTFYLSEEDGTPVETAGLGAKAYVQAGGRTETLTLTPEAPNKLVSALKAPLPAGARIVLSARFHGHNLQARFTP